MVRRRLVPRRERSGGKRPALTLVEVLAVIAVMGVLLAMAAPSFSRTMEQTHADVAGANLRAVWIAQRMFWLENRAYAETLTELESIDLLDPAVTNSSRYSIEISDADDATFVASATRVGSNRWTGAFQIDETGAIAGVVVAAGEPDITPGFQ